MTIIEAIQAAENGACITNRRMKISGSFLRYNGAGEFRKYELIRGKPEHKWDVNTFSMGDILDISWEVLPNDPFNTPLK